jgi:hypothetical protein
VPKIVVWNSTTMVYSATGLWSGVALADINSWLFLMSHSWLPDFISDRWKWLRWVSCRRATARKGFRVLIVNSHLWWLFLDDTVADRAHEQPSSTPSTRSVITVLMFVAWIHFSSRSSV